MDFFIVCMASRFAWFSGVSCECSSTTGCRWRQSWWCTKSGGRYSSSYAELRKCCTIPGDLGFFLMLRMFTGCKECVAGPDSWCLAICDVFLLFLKFCWIIDFLFFLFLIESFSRWLLVTSTTHLQSSWQLLLWSIICWAFQNGGQCYFEMSLLFFGFWGPAFWGLLILAMPCREWECLLYFLSILSNFEMTFDEDEEGMVS